MNGVTIACTGRLGGDPELRWTNAGKSMLTFSVAVDEHTTATEDRPAAETLWLRCVCWEELAESLAETLQRGMPVYIEGRLKHERWQAGNGEARCGLKVSCWRVEVHGQIGKRAPKREAVPA